MTVRLAQRNRPGVKTYYVLSRSKLGVEHTVVHVRRAGMNRWSCTCGKFVHRLQWKKTHRHCHHIKEVRLGEFENLKNVVEFRPTLTTLLSASIAIVEAKKESHA